MNNNSKCQCGKKLDYLISPFIQPEQRVCPKCGRIHYVDEPINWAKVNSEEAEIAKDKN